jgi:hypothetical protein
MVWHRRQQSVTVNVQSSRKLDARVSPASSRFERKLGGTLGAPRHIFQPSTTTHHEPPSAFIIDDSQPCSDTVMSKKDTLPDAWDDEWESVADVHAAFL